MSQHRLTARPSTSFQHFRVKETPTIFLWSSFALKSVIQCSAVNCAALNYSTVYCTALWCSVVTDRVETNWTDSVETCMGNISRSWGFKGVRRDMGGRGSVWSVCSWGIMYSVQCAD